MVQQILTYIIIASAIANVVWHIISFLRTSPQQSQGCCSMGCSGSCGLKSEILKNIKAKEKSSKNNHPNNYIYNKTISDSNFKVRKNI